MTRDAVEDWLLAPDGQCMDQAGTVQHRPSAACLHDHQACHDYANTAHTTPTYIYSTPTTHTLLTSSSLSTLT
ncbi:hypothetical protein E2C01_085459 [Portunus trituberculatus]|uniref:Uncharacterized protein n=1 Tax=Portunus trituberculatus TaxID=210409 RepID=A0A5B7IY40_PORTR|nr:hypothetical protein [Portunus trituberculatus]